MKLIKKKKEEETNIGKYRYQQKRIFFYKKGTIYYNYIYI